MNDIFLMRWDGIPLAKITKSFEKKIIIQLNSKPLDTIWFGYSGVQWLNAFNEKDEAQRRTHIDNKEAEQKLSLRKKEKQLNLEYKVFKLLSGICKAANITKP